MFNPFARLRYKLNPEKAIDLKRNETLHTQHFYNLSRETRIMAAREITESVYRLENVNGKMTQEQVFKFATEMANHTVSRDELVCKDVAKTVMKLYHLGLQIPDHQL